MAFAIYACCSSPHSARNIKLFKKLNVLLSPARLYRIMKNIIIRTKQSQTIEQKGKTIVMFSIFWIRISPTPCLGGFRILVGQVCRRPAQNSCSSTQSICICTFAIIFVSVFVFAFYLYLHLYIDMFWNICICVCILICFGILVGQVCADPASNWCSSTQCL